MPPELNDRPSLGTLGALSGEPPSYARGLKALDADGVPFLVGGAVALAAYCGIHRNTKDLDLFVREHDVSHVLDVLVTAGFRPEAKFPHWLSKAHADDHYIDVIFNSGNGEVPVDQGWFDHATRAQVLGVSVLICPAEETIWSKAFVMERERFDGADVAHLLLACGPRLDWQRLLSRFGDHARVLFAHLILFGYAFPSEAERIPRWVMDELSSRVRADPGGDVGDEDDRVCRGTFLSREQYLPDLARGWQDARLPPTGSMSSQAIALWTDAIGRGQ
ncbi:MAG TPA: nucleotidyltransferase [Polyangiaceae bacterium]|nr:nucleotidyltransferase [Polyangiaceae bacterium]